MAHLTPEDREAMEEIPMGADSWRPERKIVAAAIATIIMAVVGMVWPDLDVPPGVEAAAAVVVAYLIPNPS